MKRLSIIIPVYGVETYIERCIKSIATQDIPREEFEIICINDGSPDKSRDIILELQKDISNLILIEQENQGVSVARNKGIQNSSGNYIMMVDADDFLHLNVLYDRLLFVERNELDIGFAGYTILNEKEEQVYSFNVDGYKSEIISGIDFYNRYRRGNSSIKDPHRSWAIFFKRSYFISHDFHYLKGVPYLEDGELMARVNCLASRVAFMNGSIYLRTTRAGAATYGNLFFSEKAQNGFLIAANNLVTFKNSYCKSEEQKTFMNQSIVHFIVLYLSSHRGLNIIKYYSRIRKNLKRGPLRNIDTNGCSRFYIRMGRNYNRSIWCFYFKWIIIKIQKSLQKG